jgi:amino acid permease
VNPNNVSVFRLYEVRKARSNELEDTAMEAIIIIIIIIIILQLTGVGNVFCLSKAEVSNANTLVKNSKT